VNALIDTGLLLDYLRGDERAALALRDCAHRSITVATWLEVMRASPPDRREATRAFLRTFERLSISESSTDEAMRLSFAHPGLSAERAVNWANAIVNQLVFMTTDPTGCPSAPRDVIVPYEAGESAAGRMPRRRGAR
jgi:predicted nucleic acid-binding protein